MRLLFFLSLTLLPLCHVAAQQVDYNKIIPPANVAKEDFSEKLVLLAWQNYPLNTAAQLNEKKAEYEVTMAKWEWLNRITISGNLNEYTITGGPDDGDDTTPRRSLYYPRYNISLSFSPGMFVQIPLKRKQAEENLSIASLQVNDQKLQIRKQVLQLYYDYLMQKQLLELETKAFETATAEFEVKEERFKRGQVLLDDYNTSAKAYIGQQRSKLNAENSYMRSKLELESYIGVRLEDVR